MNDIEPKDIILLILGWLISKALDCLTCTSRKIFQKVFNKRKKPKPKRRKQ